MPVERQPYSKDILCLSHKEPLIYSHNIDHIGILHHPEIFLWSLFLVQSYYMSWRWVSESRENGNFTKKRFQAYHLILIPYCLRLFKIKTKTNSFVSHRSKARLQTINKTHHFFANAKHATLSVPFLGVQLAIGTAAWTSCSTITHNNNIINKIHFIFSSWWKCWFCGGWRCECDVGKIHFFI